MINYLMSFFWKEPSNSFLSPDYVVTYGSKDAKTKVVEYFSLSCHECFKVFKTDFQDIKTRFIDTNKVHWTFCPYPYDLPTLQMMYGMEVMPIDKKKVFFETLMYEEHGVSQDILEITLKAMGEKTDLSRVRRSRAFRQGFALTQKIDLAYFPTFVIDGKDTQELVSFLKGRDLL